MAALRCAARRLGGSLIQGTQEGCRLVPGRFMRSRQLSTKHASETPKELKPSEVQSKLKQNSAKLRAKLDKLEKAQPDEFTLRVMAIRRAVDGVIKGAAKLAIFVIVTASAFGGEEVEAQALTKRN